MDGANARRDCAAVGVGQRWEPVVCGGFGSVECAIGGVVGGGIDVDIGGEWRFVWVWQNGRGGEGGDSSIRWGLLDRGAGTFMWRIRLTG